MNESKEYYDERADGYDEVFDTLYFRVYDAVTWKHLEPYVPTERNALVLDAGGGSGRWAIKMAAKGCRIILLDSSEGMLEVASAKMKTANLQGAMEIIEGDMAGTGFRDETFDMILCEHALFLFKDPIIILKELVRILKKKARLIVSAQNRYVLSLGWLSGKPSSDNVDRAFRTLTRKDYQCMTPDGKVKVYTWTPNELQTMLERNGLCVEKIVGKGITMPLRIRKETYLRKDYPQDLLDSVLKIEFALCEEPDALGLAGHLQAIAHKR